MISRSTSIVLGLSTIAATCALTGCEATPVEVSWQPNGQPQFEHPNQEWWHYQYFYHPEIQAYFEPYTKRWSWFEEGAWHEGSALPEALTPDMRLMRTVRLAEPIPYRQHETVAQLYSHPNTLPMRFDPEAWFMVTPESQEVFVAGAEDSGANDF